MGSRCNHPFAALAHHQAAVHCVASLPRADSVDPLDETEFVPLPDT